MPIIEDHTVRFMGTVRRIAMERLEEAANLVASRAKVNVPVDTGALKKSIHVELDDNELKARVVADALRKTPAKTGPLSYAWYVETGEGTGAAQPYLRPALHSSLEDIGRIFSK